MRRFTIISAILLMMLLMLPGSMRAQELNYSVSGVVRDASNNHRLPQVSISTMDGNETTVTNADGHFILKTEKKPSCLFVSCLGYDAQKIVLGETTNKELKIRLKPGTVTLDELIVAAINPRDVVNAALSKMPENYSHDNQLLRCFYRETTQKGKI